jgi:tRNA (guanine37-N1)-methyltransferase
MKIKVLSLFPGMLKGFFESSIMARAVKKGLVEYELIDIRDYALDRHHKCDDLVFGGGAGMLMLPEPLSRCLEAAGARGKRTVFVTPSGRLFNQAYARDLASEEELIILCGHYEGVDQRVIEEYVDDEVSIGDYVLSSGEVAALVLVDAVFRLIPGVITGESLEEESFGGPEGRGLLEYPQYTRPSLYGTMKVPDVLTSGHHANIAGWRLRESIRKTLAYRPELLASAGLPEEVKRLLAEIAIEGGSHEPYPEDPGRADQA